MGYKQTYICKTCGYSVMTSGGRNAGMQAVTDTYICLSCEKIVDVLVAYMGHSVELETQRKSYYKCPKCINEVTTIWDVKTKPCPKCQGTMEIDPEGRHMRWD